LPPLWGIPAEKEPSEIEIEIVTGLAPAEYYWFAMKAVDRYYKISDIDKNAEYVTSQAKAYASTSIEEPTTITSIQATPVLGEPYSVKLNWIAPGNNGNQGGSGYIYILV